MKSKACKAKEEEISPGWLIVSEMKKPYHRYPQRLGIHEPGNMLTFAMFQSMRRDTKQDWEKSLYSDVVM